MESQEAVVDIGFILIGLLGMFSLRVSEVFSGGPLLDGDRLDPYRWG